MGLSQNDENGRMRSSGPMTPTLGHLYVTGSEGVWSVGRLIPLG
jgi:hypothetical protein